MFSSCNNVNVQHLPLHNRLNWFELECIDLNHRAKCLNKGNKLKWGFAMSGANKKRLLCSDCLISRHISSFDCWECMYYIDPGDCIFVLQCQFY